MSNGYRTARRGRAAAARRGARRGRTSARSAAVSADRSTVSVNGTNVPGLRLEEIVAPLRSRSRTARAPAIAASASSTSASPSRRRASSSRSCDRRSPPVLALHGAASAAATVHTSSSAATAVRRPDRARPVLDANCSRVRRMYLIYPVDHRRPPRPSQSARRAGNRLRTAQPRHEPLGTLQWTRAGASDARRAVISSPLLWLACPNSWT